MEGGVGAECLTVYYPRLMRGGWQLIHMEPRTSWTPKTDIFDKPLDYDWTLRKLVRAGCNDPPGKSCYWDTRQLIHPVSKTTIVFDDWEWAERDGDRLVWTTAGKLFAREISAQGLDNEVELHDFNEMRFETITAPY